MYSDQASLRRLLGISDPNGQLMRWRMHLSEVDFDVRYKNGFLNTQANAIFYLRSFGEAFVLVDADIPTYQPPSNAIPYNRNGKRNLNAELALTTDTSPSFLPITLKEILLTQDDDKFYLAICARIREEETGPFALSDDKRCSAP